MDTTDVVRILGVDPGSVTGFVCLELPSGARDLSAARWYGSRALNAPTRRKNESKPESEARWHRLVCNAALHYRPAVTVLEDPTDGMAKWSGGMARGTNYGLGRTYGLILGALSIWGGRLHAYPVAGTKKKPGGWMPKVRGGKNGNLIHVMSGKELVPLLRRYARAIPLNRNAFQFPAEEEKRRRHLTEHELMAFGVLRYHIEYHGA